MKTSIFIYILFHSFINISVAREITLDDVFGLDRVTYWDTSEKCIVKVLSTKVSSVRGGGYKLTNILLPDTSHPTTFEHSIQDGVDRGWSNTTVTGEGQFRIVALDMNKFLILDFQGGVSAYHRCTQFCPDCED